MSGSNVQKFEIDLGTIAGGEEKEAKWIVRGDKQGSYNLEAQFNGTLQPFEVPVQKSFRTQEPVKVWGSSALRMHIKAEDWAFAGEPYHVYVGLENVSDHTVYNATLRIGESEGYVLEPNSPSVISVQELEPGPENIIWIDVCLIPCFEGFLDLSNTFTLNLSDGDADISTVYETIESARKQYHLQPKTDPQTMEADPVNTSTGAHIIQRNLLTVNGIRPVPFGVSYNSQLLDEGLLGKGWSHDFETRLEQAADGNIIIHWNASCWNKYYGNGSGEFTSPDLGVKLDKLVKNQDGSYTLTRNDQTVYRFNPAGWLVRLQNKNGQYVEMTYDTEGKLITITEPVSGQTLAISYNENGLIEKVTDKLNRQVMFEYDDARNLIGITGADGKTTTYTYNSEGRILTGTNADGVRIFSDTYDEQGRVVEQDDAVEGNRTTRFSYDTVSESGKIITTVTDREGNKRVLTHNRKYRLIKVNDKLGNTTSYAYDADGNRIKAVDAKGNTFSYGYDARGNLVSIVDAAGSMTSMSYDGRNNLISVQNAVYNSTEFTYDANNNIISVTDPDGSIISRTYDSNGLILTTTKPGQGTISCNYENGKLKTVTDPVGNTISYGYDTAGRLASITDAVYKTTTFEYDNADNLIKVTDPLGNSISYTYDSRHNRLTETDAKGNVTRYTYNGNGKLTSVTDALNNRTEFEYNGEDRLIKTIDARGNSAQITYDASGQVIALTDPLGNTTGMHYDAVGSLISQEDAIGRQILTITYDELNNPLTVTDAVYRTTTNRYDSLNRLVETIDAMGRSTKYNYDNLNRLVTVVDALNGQSVQGFDADGNLTATADPNNNRTGFNYDKAGRLTSETPASGSITTYQYGPGNYLAKETNGRGLETTYRYDDAGQLTSFTDPAGTVSYTYDANGSVVTTSDEKGTITREYDALDRIIKYKDAAGNEIQYNYDEVGNLVTLTYPDGKQVKYTYDAADRMSGVTDWAGRTTAYEYDANGRLIKTTRPNGTVQTLSYDAAGQLLEQKDTDRNGNIISQYNYTYDAAGNVTSEQSTVEEQIFEAQETAAAYVYGNRLDTFNGQQIVYDQDGNMTRGPLGDFEYDARNRLVRAGETEYAYDAENNRISVTDGVYTDSYVMNPAYLSQVLIKTDEQGKKTYYVYGLGLIGQEEDGVYNTYHYDCRGSTVALTDMDGNVTDRFQYGPYGELVYRTGSTETPLLYNGKYGVMTDGNGLYYMRARYYSPELKRFINQDVIQGSILDGRSLNRYAYVNGNPVSYIDPFGLSAEESTGNYFADSFEQLFLGNYSGKVTALGTGAQILTGLIGIDAPGDIRDIAYDLQHWELSWRHAGKTFLDGISIVPVIGMLKYSDEVVIVVKRGNKTELPSLDSTGKVHGKLPSSQELKNYSREELEILYKELQQSVKQRIKKNIELGSDAGHGERQAAEQQLIKSIEKYLGW